MREERNVLESLSKRRDLDRENVQAVVEIFPEFAVGDHLLRIAVRGSDNARVDIDFLVPADAAESSLFEHAQ